MLDLRRFEAITFDCYGTLVDWANGIVNSVRPVLDRHGRGDVTDTQIVTLYAEHEPVAEAPPWRPYRDVLVTTMTRMAGQLEIRLDRGEERAILDGFESWPVFGDAVPALHELAARHRIGIISNVDDELFELTRRKLPVDFAWVITAEQAKAYKPDVTVFELAERVIEVPRERWLHVGESRYHDVAPAKSLGITSVLVDRAGLRATKRTDTEPDWIVPDLASLARRDT